MHQVVRHLARALGTSIVNRDAFETWLYDGQTLADHYWVKPDPMDPPGSTYYFKPYVVYYDDVSFLHELGHLQAAKPEQRDLPEFGLAMGIADGTGYGPNGGEFRRLDGRLKDVPSEVFDGLVDREEQDIQECLAQLFSIFWGQKYGVPFAMKGWKMEESWQFYFEYKIAKNDGQDHSEASLLKTWTALVRFREMLESGIVAS